MKGAHRAATVPILLFGVTSISFAAILIRLTVSPPVVVAAWRMALAAAILLPWVLLRRPLPLGREGWGLSLLSGIFLALHFSLWITSLRLTTVASSVVLVTTNPLFVGLFSLFLGERPSWGLWQGIGLSLTGGFLIGWGDLSFGGRALLGDLLALLGAIMASGYLMIGRRVRDRAELLPYVLVSYGTSGVLLLGLCALGPWGVLPQGGDWPWLLLLALGPQILGHTSINWSLRRLPAAAVAVAILGEPLGSSLWAFLIFGEGIRPLQGVGMALVLAGIARGLRAQART